MSSAFFLPAADDFMETVKNVTFKPLENTTCAEVPIVDDNNMEVSEDFTVGFGSTLPPIPGLSVGMTALSTVTIIDDDDDGEAGGGG
jgi:hypothetical protein